MLTTEENELLCRVEGDAPMGQIFRRHWLPALPRPRRWRSPTAIRSACACSARISSLFRDTDGRLGLIDEHCPHRRASLFYGRNEECGLRCLYHGWKFDVEGNCVEMASEPAESSFCDKVKIKSYPVRRERRLRLDLHGPARDDAGVRAAGVRADAETNGRRPPR